MIKFSQEKVLLLHKLITEETGGDPNVRDIALLNSALESAFATFDEQELYPTKQEKGARLGYALISNHAFVDGNKRIGMYVRSPFWKQTVSRSVPPWKRLPVSVLPLLREK